MIATNWKTWKRNGEETAGAWGEEQGWRQSRRSWHHRQGAQHCRVTVVVTVCMSYYDSYNVLHESTGDHRVKEDDCNQRIPNSQLCNYLAWRRPCYWLVWKLKSQDCEENASAIDADREEAVLIRGVACDDDSMTFFCLGTGESAAPRSIAIPSWGTSLVGKSNFPRYLLSPILFFLQGQFGLSIHQRQGRPWNHMLRWGGRFACQKYHPAGHCGAKGQQSSSGHRDIPRLKGGNVFCFKYFKCGFA